MNLGEFRKLIEGLPDDMDLRVVEWAGTCYMARIVTTAGLVHDRSESEAYAVDDDGPYPFVEVAS